MKQKKLDKLIEVSKIVKKKYVIKYGVLRWGLPMAIIFSLKSVINNTELGEMIEGIIISSIVFPIGGIFFGLITWDLTQRYISKHTEVE